MTERILFGLSRRITRFRRLAQDIRHARAIAIHLKQRHARQGIGTWRCVGVALSRFVPPFSS